MFSKKPQLHTHGDQHHYETTTITEKRAPTDESVKIVREYEQAAWEKAKQRVAYDLLDIKAEATLMERYDMFGSWWVIVKINGKTFEMEIEKPKDDYRIMELIAQAIAADLTSKLGNAIRRY